MTIANNVKGILIWLLITLSSACTLFTVAHAESSLIRLTDAVDLESAQSLFWQDNDPIPNSTVVTEANPIWLGMVLGPYQPTDILQFASPFIQLYEIYDAASGRLLFSGGTLKPASARTLFHPEFLIPLGSIDTTGLLIKLLAPAGNNIPILLVDEKTERSSTALRFLTDGVYFGTLSLMIVFSLSVALYGSDLHFARLGITLFVWLLTMATAQGYGSLLLWPENAEFTNFLFYRLIVLASLVSSWFASHFLQNMQTKGLFYWLHQVLIYVAAVSLLASIFINISSLASTLLMATGILVLSNCIVRAKEGDDAAKSFLVSALFSAAPILVLPIVPGIHNLQVVTGSTALVFIVIALMQRLGERIRKNEMAAEMAENRSRFLASMSHEIRTPLNGIIGCSELCLLEKPRGELKKLIGQIARSSNLLLTIVNDVLDFSKLEADSVEIENLPTNVRQIIEDALVSVGPAAGNKEVKLHIEIPDSIPEFIVTDPNRLVQILINLCSNAIKFTAKGSVTIKLQQRAGNLYFEIIDTGIGIEEKLLATLFDPFKQASVSTARQYGGTGLGLTIAKQLSGLLGGALAVVSKPGRGSTFTLSIPMVIAKKPVLIGPDKIDMAALMGSNILIAEDNQVNQLVTSRILEKAGCSTAIAENGKHAVELAMSTNYDLILMDMQMPQLNGIEATRQLRSKGITTPIIAMTANTSDKDRQASMQAGMNDFITKPIQSSSLYSTLISWVDHSHDEWLISNNPG